MATVYISNAHKMLAERLGRDTTSITERSVFNTYMHLIVFAAMVGYANDKLSPLDSKDRGPEIEEQVFRRHDLDGLVYLLALEKKEDSNMLREERISEAWRLMEGYAQGGFEIIQQWFLDSPGDVDGVDTLLARITEYAAERAKVDTQPLQPTVDF